MLEGQILPAFDAPVMDSQRVFRQLLKAMSEPGTLSTLPASSEDPGALHTSTWSIARTLFDHDTPIYLSAGLRTASVMQSIQFQTEASLTEQATAAQFAVLNLAEFSDCEAYACGSLERPHESCTLLIQVPSLFSEGQSVPAQRPDTPEPQRELHLSGPGIREARRIRIGGLQAAQLGSLQQNHQLYPCGVDLVFCCQNAFLALPRSTVISSPSIA